MTKFNLVLKAFWKHPPTRTRTMHRLFSHLQGFKQRHRLQIAHKLTQHHLHALTFMLLCLFFTSLESQAAEAEEGVSSSSSIKTVKDKPPKVEEETVERELSTGEDPLAVQTREIDEKPVYRYKDHTSYNFYGSARLRYSESNESDELNDGGSRIGMNGELQFTPKFWLLGRIEVGFHLDDGLAQLLKKSENPSKEDGNASKRLVYGGIQTNSTTLTFGKNWSSYYQVSGLTDRFDSFGGNGSGTYNAGTDGGNTGTGRADRAIQGRFSINAPPEKSHLKPFKLNVQLQNEEAIPYGDGAQYGYTVGISALLETESEKVIGIAYNHATIDDTSRAALKARGIDGDARALVLGTRRFDDRYYLGSTISFLDNHETTDGGQYFKGWGWEVFGSYNFKKRLWLTGGWNLLQPEDNDPLIGEFQIRYAILGLRYTFKDLRKYLYTEIRQDYSQNTNGDEIGNVYTIGVRWDIL